MESKSSIFYRELRVPNVASGVVRGKRAATIKAFQQTAGISSVEISPGKVEIRAYSEEALERVAVSIEQLVSFGIDKSNSYFPEFFALCFCLSVEKPLLAVSEVCFQECPVEISNIYEAKQQAKPYFCFKSGKACEGSDGVACPGEASFDVDNLSVDFCSKFSVTDIMLFPGWDYSVYKSALTPCLEPLLSWQHETMREVKLAVRFGKQLFHGTEWSRLQNGGFMSLAYLQDLCSRNRLKQRFSTACTESAVRNLRLYALENSEYVKISGQNKISLHVVDLQYNRLQFNVSIRRGSMEERLRDSEIRRICRAEDYFQVLGVEPRASEQDLQKAYRTCLIRIQADRREISGSAFREGAIKAVNEAYEHLMDPVKRRDYLINLNPHVCPSPLEGITEDGEGEVEITRVRNQPKRHGFVAFMREGPATTDFRLGVVTHGTDVPICPEMVDWIKDGWRNRTSDGLLGLAPPGRFQVLHVRYKKTETFVTENWRLRIAKVREGYRKCKNMTERWECVLSSRWFKRNAATMEEIDVAMENVRALVRESAKLSGLMAENLSS